MKLPERIPKQLRNSALLLPEFGDGEGAWLRGDAVAVLESLRGSNVIVSEVVLFEQVPWVGYAASEFTLSLDRVAGEPDLDYAKRSRSSAVDFIRTCPAVGDEAVFKLTFPIWKDAA